MGITQSETAKRRGRPTVNSEQLAEYTPARFHKVSVFEKKIFNMSNGSHNSRCSIYEDAAVP